MSTHQYNIAFFGTPPLTISFLETLATSGYIPTLIVTNPDRPQGRGMTLTAPLPKQWAETHAVQVVQPEVLDDAFFAELSNTPWDLFVVVAYGTIIPERIITLPKYGTINVHFSLLPQYRGATPIEAAILQADTTTGISIQQMAYKLDTGPVLTHHTEPISTTDTTETLRERLTTLACDALPKTITDIFEGAAIAIPQDESKATYCKKIQKEDGFISLTDNASILDRKFRAYTPRPGIFFMTPFNGQNIRVKITKAHYDTENAFSIDEVIPENMKRMSYASFKQLLT